MNKKQKCTIFISTILFAHYFINKAIFFIANKNYPSKKLYKQYDWRLGKIAYDVSGEGKPVLLIHGTTPGQSSDIFNNNVTELSKHYKVYSIDLLGYGSSERVFTTFTAYTYASLINDFINDIIGSPTAIIAQGEGAMFSMAAYMQNPDNFKKMILVCPKGISDSYATNEDRELRKLYELPLLGESIYLYNTSMEKTKEITKSLIYSQNKASLVNERFYCSSHVGGANNKYTFSSYITNFMNIDTKPYFDKLNIPLLSVWGDKSHDFNNMQIMKELTSSAQYAVFEDTASLPNLENSSEFNKIAKEFLDQ